MPPVHIDLRKAEDRRDVVHRAVQALAEGKLVAFPTETVYGLGASARHSRAIERLVVAKGRPQGAPFALAIKSAAEAADYVPDMPPLARRLARRCWPGPVTLVMEDAHPDGLINQLSDSVRQVVCPDRTLGLRVPASECLLEVLRMIPGPIALTSANRRGEPDATDAGQVLQALGDEVALVLDDGPSRYGQPSSVVRVGPQGFQLLREGVVSECTVRRLASVIVVMVCTGNTCRSPMAELLMRKSIADQLGCDMGQLEDRGVMVLSAGIAASAGSPAAFEAVEVMDEHGLDLRGHESRPLSDQLVRHADLILTMTRGHRDAIIEHWPEAAERSRLLMPNESDVADPIGQTVDVYRACASQIDEAARVHGQRLLRELL